MDTDTFWVLLIITVLCGILWRINRAWTCPECGDMLDSDHHGYEKKYGHCHNCGWCNYCSRKKV